ncbi:hypothetical protein BH11ACT4_BH11ACT4_10120 [soil metagenome]
MRDDELLSRFEDGTLTPFPHESHLRVVYLLIQRDGPDAALAAVTAGIRAMARAIGRPEAFHVTRTTAWTRLVAATITAGEGQPAGSLEWLAGHPELVRRDLLDDYYSAGRLLTDEARTGFVGPDLRPLD